MRRLSPIPAVVTLLWLVPAGTAWLAELSMMSPLPGPALAPASLDALHVVLLAQCLSLVLFAPQWQAAAVPTALLPAWPLLALLGYATGVTLITLMITQLFAAAAGLLVVAVTAPLRRPAGGDTLRLARASAGLVAAAIAWLLRDAWLPGAVL